MGSFFTVSLCIDMMKYHSKYLKYVIEFFTWYGFTSNQLAFLSCYAGNLECFNLCKIDDSNDHDFDPEHFVIYNNYISCINSLSHGQAAILSGNVELLKKVEPRRDYLGFYDYDTGDSEYDLAILSGNKEMIWYLFEEDIALKDREIPMDVHCASDDDNYLVSLVKYLSDNNYPERGEDENDEWELSKFKQLIDKYPCKESIDVIYNFKKPHFYYLIKCQKHIYILYLMSIQSLMNQMNFMLVKIKSTWKLLKNT